MNKPIREGFVSADDEARTIEHEPPQNPTPTKARAMSDADAPPPLDLDAPAPEVEWPVRLKLLYKPTRNVKNEIIHELTLRAPTARDIRQCGNPVRIDRNGDVIVDDEKMTAMLAALANVFPPMIEVLDARDWSSCSFFLQRFFLPNSATWTPSIPS
jgi:Phage tail assembly chaperone proteins, E, or 41 or 14